MHPLLAGAIAGSAATAPMTMAMDAMHRRLPRRLRYPLPPRLIVEQLGAKTGLAAQAGEATKLRTTLAAHFGYGAAAGMLRAALPARLRGDSAVAGMAFGLGVWTVSYLGLLPGMRILPPATRQPLPRRALMIAAHVVWGAALGTLARRLAGGDARGR